MNQLSGRPVTPLFKKQKAKGKKKKEKAEVLSR